MNFMGKRAALAFACLLIAGLVVAGIPARNDPATPVYHYQVVHTYPHDPFAFTEGLAYADGYLIEGTGLNGNSTLRKVNLTTGEIVQERQLAGTYFGEGVAVFGNRTAELTEDSDTGFIYDAGTLVLLGNFSYTTEGWGLTYDGARLIMSDGTDVLHFLDPVSFRELGQVRVQDRNGPVGNLNELEYVNGEIYANVWPTDRIAMISPATGNITGWIDLTGLLPKDEQNLIGWPEIAWLKGRTSIPFREEACLNGIAYDPTGDRLFVTGKLWPELFEIKVVR